MLRVALLHGFLGRKSTLLNCFFSGQEFFPTGSQIFNEEGEGQTVDTNVKCATKSGAETLQKQQSPPA